MECYDNLEGKQPSEEEAVSTMYMEEQKELRRGRGGLGRRNRKNNRSALVTYEVEETERTPPMQPGSITSAPRMGPEWSKLSSYRIPLGPKIGPWMGSPNSTHTNELRSRDLQGAVGRETLPPLG